MATTALDTIEAVRRLTKEYEFSEKQAEGITVMMRDSVMSDLATKEDMEGLKKNMGDLATKEELQNLEERMGDLATKEELQNLEERMALKMEVVVSRYGKEILDKMDSRFAEMEVRFREMEVRFREMDKRFHQTMVLTLLAIGVATAVVSAVIAL